MVETYLKYYTFLQLVEINAIVELHRRNPERRTAQRKLADEVTAIVHGAAEAQKASKITDVQFGGADLASLNPDERKAFEASVPTATYVEGLGIVDALTQNGFIVSKSEARRLIDGKGIKLNGETVSADRALVNGDFENGVALLQKGKSDKLRVLK
jgi:tyrosyl-tRNA synthetase